MVVLGVPLFVGLEFAATDEDARVAEGLLGRDMDEDFRFFLSVSAVFVGG